jgi:hypothetical protein
MQTETLEVVCAASIQEPNTWYIFRNNGVEVKIELVGGQFKSNKELTDTEIEYLHTNLR